MLIRLQFMRILAWGLVLTMVLLAMGCGNRSLHGSKRYSKDSHKGRMVALKPNASGPMSSNRAAEEKNGGEGYFGSPSGTFSDLLDEETLIEEDPQFNRDGQMGGSPNDYWVNRTRAEQFTAQSGLEDVHFDFNSIQLNEKAKTTLMANAEWLKENPNAEVTIEGHCDDRGTSSYNYVLGEKRALRTKNYLSSLGVSGDRLHVMTFGKDNPACVDQTESCFQKNRRAHLVLDLDISETAMR